MVGLFADVRGRIAAASARGGRGTRSALALGGVLALALLGAFLFGLWHVGFGGVVKGNWRAGGFGAALAVVSGAILWLEAAVARRLLPPAGPRQ